ncbi:S-adenosyl-L-methionine-dependent methyltransferase [Aspergillus tetrazonus]
MALESDRKPLINNNPQILTYYNSLESRIGYRLLLNGTRHFGYYENDTWWPFPLSMALREMEDKLAASLNLPPGSYVLDAGCGIGHVALQLASKHGLRVEEMDYHHLENFEAETFDGIYTMETFFHATEPEAVLAGVFSILKPGGRLSLFEYDHELDETSPDVMAQSMRKINEFAVMPTNSLSHPGVFQRMLEGA